MQKFIFVTLILVLVGMVSFADEKNLITNSSFEIGETGWLDNITGNPEGVRKYLSSEKAHSGKFSIKFENSALLKHHFTQLDIYTEFIPVKPGKIYHLKAWVLVPDSFKSLDEDKTKLRGAHIGVPTFDKDQNLVDEHWTVAGSGELRCNKATENNWYCLEKEFTVRDNVAFVKIKLGLADSGVAYFDDISLIEKEKSTDKMLVGWWSFDEGEGEIAKDFSGRGHTGKVINATWSDDAVKGKALRFNGRDSRVVIETHPDLQLSGAGTISAWIKLDKDINRKNAYEIVNCSPDRGPGFRFFVQYGHVYFRTGKGYGKPVWGIGEFLPPLGEWHHICVSFDGKKYSIYIDGELKKELEESRPVTVNYGAPLTIGAYMGSATRCFKGSIDEVKIWNYALTSEEIAKESVMLFN